jgi:ATP-dependent helicase/nuclease subunit B
MAVQFILGRSGTGKTHLCIESIVESLRDSQADRPLILLVPEQATYQAERSILSRNVPGYSRLHIMSFDRLRFLLLGPNVARDEISRIGREMLVHKILMENRDKLKLFAGSAETTGLAAKLTSLIIELHHAAKDTEDIDGLIQNLNSSQPDSLTSAKFHDLGLVYKDYLKQIESKFINPDIQLTNACQKVSNAALLKDAEIWVDGFASFTIQQTQLLAEILRAAGDVSISLCLDPELIDVKEPDEEKLDPLSLFNPTEQTYVQLVEIVRRSGLSIKPAVILKEPLRFTGSPDLQRLEKYLFEDNIEPIESKGSIQIAAATNRRAEVAGAARKILQLVKEQNFRFRDIAVIVADLQNYQHYIEAVFGDYGISFFIDRPKQMHQHPVVELITAGLQTIINDYSFADVFDCLKSGLMPLKSDEVDMLENYCIAFGIDHEDFTSEKPWLFAGPEDEQFDEDKINALKRKALEPVHNLKANLTRNDSDGLLTAHDFTKSLWTFLDELDVLRRLLEWSSVDSADTLGHRQFYEKLVDIFDELNEIFTQPMPLAEFANLISAAFKKLTLKLIPPTLDQVLVGSIERSRHPDLKAVLLLGVTQKQFPQPLSFDSVLTDDDRDLAQAYDFVLSDSLQQHLLRRNYLAYIALTRPSQFLYVTYPLTSDDGSKVEPSGFLNKVKNLFTGLEDSVIKAPSGFEEIYTHRELAEMLCSSLAPNPTTKNPERSLAQLFLQKMHDSSVPGLTSLASNVTEALNYDNNAELEPEAAQNFFPEILNCSPSRLQKFAACPYQHFASHILRLQQRKVFQFEPVDVGSFYHRVLDGLYRRLSKVGKDFASASDDRLKELCSQQIEELVRKDPFISNFVSRCAYNEYIIASASDTLAETVVTLARMSRAGDFRQISSELRFGFSTESDDSRLITTLASKKIRLRGCIDRIDLAQIGQKQAAVVFDYKKRPTSFSFREFYHGLELQLPMYLLALSQMKFADKEIALPAGAFFIPIEPPAERASIGDFEKQGEKFTRRARGIFNGEFAKNLDNAIESGWSEFYNFYFSKKEQAQYGSYGKSGALKPEHFDAVLNYTKNKITEFADKIFQGHIQITPYRLGKESACSRCIYSCLCKFDWQINRYNPLTSLNKDSALELMEARNAN